MGTGSSRFKVLTIRPNKKTTKPNKKVSAPTSKGAQKVKSLKNIKVVPNTKKTVPALHSVPNVNSFVMKQAVESAKDTVAAANVALHMKDPFHHGIAVPAGPPGGVITLSMGYQKLIECNSTGDFAGMLSPVLNASDYFWTLTGGNTIDNATSPGSWNLNPHGVQLNADYSSYRVISYAVKLETVANTDLQAGVAMIAQLPSDYLLTPSYFDAKTVDELTDYVPGTLWHNATKSVQHSWLPLDERQYAWQTTDCESAETKNAGIYMHTKNEDDQVFPVPLFIFGIQKAGDKAAFQITVSFTIQAAQTYDQIPIIRHITPHFMTLVNQLADSKTKGNVIKKSDLVKAMKANPMIFSNLKGYLSGKKPLKLVKEASWYDKVSNFIFGEDLKAVAGDAWKDFKKAIPELAVAAASAL